MYLDKEQITDILVGALEGGSNYWYFLDQTSIDCINAAVPKNGEPLALRLYEAVVEKGATIPVYDYDTAELLGNLTKESIDKGTYTVMNDEFHHVHYNDLISERDDATTYDVFFQHWVMGKMIFG